MEERKADGTPIIFGFDMNMILDAVDIKCRPRVMPNNVQSMCKHRDGSDATLPLILTDPFNIFQRIVGRMLAASHARMYVL